MKAVSQATRIIRLTALGVVLLGGGLLVIFADGREAASFALGVAVSFLYLTLLHKQIDRLSLGTPAQAKKSSVQALFLRYLIVIVALFCASQVPGIDLYLVLAGLLLIPLSSVVLYLTSGYEKKT